MSPDGSGLPSAATEGEARKIDQLGGSITSKNTQSAAANQELQFHPLANIFPLMEGEEFNALVADIKATGLLQPIVLYEDKILDGRNRYRACLAAGVTPDIIELGEVREVVAIALVIAANIRRRHLTPEQKTDLLARLVAAHPEKSDRQLAKETGVTHPTIAKARRKAEATGKALPVAKRVGADGKARNRPARKQPKKKAKPAAAVMADTKRERGDDLAEQLQVAKIRMAGLQSEIEELRSAAPADGRNLVDQALKLVSRMPEAERKQFRDRLQQDFPPRRGRPRKEPQAEAGPLITVAHNNVEGASSEKMKAGMAEPDTATTAGADPASMAAIDPGLDCGPMPDCLRRVP